MNKKGFFEGNYPKVFTPLNVFAFLFNWGIELKWVMAGTVTSANYTNVLWAGIGKFFI